jgi:hypothetical protein
MTDTRCRHPDPQGDERSVVGRTLCLGPTGITHRQASGQVSPRCQSPASLAAERHETGPEGVTALI